MTGEGKLKNWLQLIQAIHTWSEVARRCMTEIDKLDPETERLTRQQHMKLLTSMEKMIGINVLRLLGVYPLDDGWDL